MRLDDELMNKNKVREFLRKYKFLVNLVVLVIGILILSGAVLVKPENGEETLANGEICI